MKIKARLFKNGGSQAIRLPKEFRFPGHSVTLARTKRGVLIEADLATERHAKIFASLEGSCPDFPDIAPNRTPDLPREPLA